ncbi:hypothetical protein HanXRQr2_Chr08g0361561 [Helianthus annuus]|uniref:Uncharacterized protein n=1 Tax=Helianthus annuus TaxID=4232 RepID=A0A9K3IIX7_HELAN|nr:hypothetical protein HanXRQr2_Chr08g0361561 [Helianthus annuus]
MLVLVLMIYYQGGQRESVDIKPFGIPPPCQNGCYALEYSKEFCCTMDTVHCCLVNKDVCNRQCQRLPICCAK